jgi:hypothetical protein
MDYILPEENNEDDKFICSRCNHLVEFVDVGALVDTLSTTLDEALYRVRQNRAGRYGLICSKCYRENSGPYFVVYEYIDK